MHQNSFSLIKEKQTFASLLKLNEAQPDDLIAKTKANWSYCFLYYFKAPVHFGEKIMLRY